MTKKFFLVSQVFYPDEVSTASLFTDLCSVMAEDDYVVEVWCAQPSYTTIKRQPGKIKYKGVNISYLAGTNYLKDHLLGRLVNITFSYSLFVKLLFSKERSPVFTVTNPPILAAVVMAACYFTKRKFIYIILDVYPDGIIRVGKISETKLVSKIWKKVNRLILGRAEKIIVLGRDMIDWVMITNSNARDRINYIPHWQNETLFHYIPYAENPFVIEHNIQDKFVVQYSGNMGMWHDMQIFARVAKNLEDNGVNFFFIGGGMRKKELFREWNDKVPSNSQVLPYQPKEKIGESLAACHVALISLREGLQGMAVPCKIYGILAAGVPVIAMVPEYSEIGLIVREENCGFVISPNDLDGLEKAILELKSDEKLRTAMGKNGRKAFEQKYSTKIIAEKYKSLIQSLN
jgi:glycosyltransferase involved in cell wall biosynthesis